MQPVTAVQLRNRRFASGCEPRMDADERRCITCAKPATASLSRGTSRGGMHNDVPSRGLVHPVTAEKREVAHRRVDFPGLRWR